MYMLLVFLHTLTNVFTPGKKNYEPDKAVGGKEKGLQIIWPQF